MKLFKSPDHFSQFVNRWTGSRILDLGCGARKLPSAFGVDILPSIGVDVVHDLNQFPYPFADGSFDAVILYHVIEHLSDVPRTVVEAHRILRPGGQVWIATPHFTDAHSWVDPSHRFHLSIQSFNACTTEGLFDMILAYVTLKGFWKDIGYERWINRGGIKGRPGSRAERWEAKYCFRRRGGEMRFILERC